MTDPLAPFLSRQPTLILDGGLATELEHRGADLDDPLWSARLLLDDPGLVRQVHLEYLHAGADCIASVSYQATYEGFARRGLSEERTTELLRLSVELARAARDRFWAEAVEVGARQRPLVAASVGPYGAFLADGSEYRGDYRLSVAELEDFHRPRLEVLSNSGADLLACETIPSLPEAVALTNLFDARLNERDAAADAVSAWISFTCRDGRSLCDGTPLRHAVAAVEASPGIIALGVNCTAPAYVADLLREAASVTDKPLVAYPNSGEGYDAASRSWLPADALVDWKESGRAWYRAGARLLGGCCRSRPANIAALRQALLE